MAFPDIVIPLGTGSWCNDLELCLLLRSIECNLSSYGRIIVVASKVPKWLDNVFVVLKQDAINDNKDANMIEKVRAALDGFDMHGNFILCADDNLFMKPIDAYDIPVLYNPNGRGHYCEDKKWHRRMRNTFDFVLERTGRELEWNYECHAPQLFNADAIRNNANLKDYIVQPGLCIYTYFRTISFEYTLGQDHRKYKTTHEKPESANAPMDKEFAGYNDAAFMNGLAKRLLEIFPNKSHYEKDI